MSFLFLSLSHIFFIFSDFLQPVFKSAAPFCAPWLFQPHLASFLIYNSFLPLARPHEQTPPTQHFQWAPETEFTFLWGVQLFFFLCLPVDLVPCCSGDTGNKHPLTPCLQARSFQAISSPVSIFFSSFCPLSSYFKPSSFFSPSSSPPPPALSLSPLLFMWLMFGISSLCINGLLCACCLFFLIPQGCFGYSQKPGNVGSGVLNVNLEVAGLFTTSFQSLFHSSSAGS